MTLKFFSLFHNEHAHNIDLHLKSVELVLLLPDELPLPCGAVAPMEVVSNSRDSYPFLTKRLAVRTNQGIFTYAAIPLTGIPFGFSLWNPYTSGAERNV